MPKYLDLEISLNDSPYPISRKIRVPAATDLHQLHHYLQIAMGWQLSHLHLFETPMGNFSDYEDDMDPTGEQPEFGINIEQILERKGSTITYCYDFGDDWSHTVRHLGSRIQPKHDGVALLDAVGVCPEEDSGGVWNLPKRCDGIPDRQLIEDRLAEYYHLTVDVGITEHTAFCHVHDVDELDDDVEALRNVIYDDIDERYGFDHLERFVEAPFDYEHLQLKAPDPTRAQASPILRAVMPMLVDMLSAPIKLTSSGYLPVSYVKSMYAEINQARYPIFREFQHKAVTSESAVLPVEVMRHLLERSNLVEASKTRMWLTLKGLELVVMRDYDQLYQVLLKTALRKFNWGYVYGGNTCPLQQSAAPMMILIGNFLDPDTAISDEYLFEILAGSIAGMAQEPMSKVPACPEGTEPRKLLFSRRFCYFFALFGIWELDAKPSLIAALTEPRQITVTSLGRDLV